MARFGAHHVIEKNSSSEIEFQNPVSEAKAGNGMVATPPSSPEATKA
jgi:hypothetical protein